MEDPAILTSPDDKKCAKCILGPEASGPSMAKLLAAGASVL